MMASDLARFLILYEKGGLYLDFDQVIYEFDVRLLSFDFIGYTTETFSFGMLITETSFVGSVPSHPIITEYLREVR